MSENVSQADVVFNSVMSVLAVVCASIASGLTQGLLSISPLEMGIKCRSGTDLEKRQAAKILPLITRHHLLLVTLMLFNATAFESLPLFLDVLVPTYLAIILSVTLVLMFGEIIPAAVFTGPHQFLIASTFAPFVWFLIIIFSPISYPISYVLDLWLGHDDGMTVFNRNEIETMMQIQQEEGTKRGIAVEEAIQGDEVSIIGGAFKLRDKTVESVMTKDVFMLSVRDTLNLTTLSTIFNSGFSRIPIYQEDRNDVIGLLLVKDLLFVDPEDDIPIKNFMTLFGRPLQSIWPDQKLKDTLLVFKKTHTHMAVVKDVDNSGPLDPFYVVKGIVTMEDILEELLGHEILDETDYGIEHIEDNKVTKQRNLFSLRQIEFAELKKIASSLVRDQFLSNEELRAVVSFLEHHVKQMKVLFGSSGDFHEAIAAYVRNCKVVSMKPDLKPMLPNRDLSTSAPLDREPDGSPRSEVDNLTSFPTLLTTKKGQFRGKCLYTRGQLATKCCLILSGKVLILAGRDEFEIEMGPWTVLAAEVLVDVEMQFTPDFSAYVASEDFRYLSLERPAAAVTSRIVRKLSAKRVDLLLTPPPYTTASTSTSSTIVPIVVKPRNNSVVLDIVTSSDEQNNRVTL